MRYLALVSGGVLMASCAPVREKPAPPETRVSEPVRTESVASAPTTPSLPQEPVRATRTEIASITFEGVAFDSRSHRLFVADQAGGPASRFADAASAGQSTGGIAAVNAGFFTPEGTPLGLVVAAGKSAGTWNSASSLGSGIWHEDGSGRVAISRRENTSASGNRELLQAGPMLIENGRAVSGLDPTKSSVRTFILWDGGNRWWIGRSTACTLAELGSALAQGNPAGWPVRHALNLDGGRSSDLWISGTVPGGPLTRRAPWNRPVRNFLILAPR